MRHLFTFLLIPAISFSIVSCDDDYFGNNNTNMNTDPSSNLTTYTAKLDGANQIPAPEVPSNQTGTAALVFDNTAKTYTVTVTHTITAPTTGGVYVGNTDEVGFSLFTFTSLISPIYYINIPLTELQEEDLQSNRFYVNIHSVAYPEGEIRGQLIYSAPE